MFAGGPPNDVVEAEDRALWDLDTRPFFDVNVATRLWQNDAPQAVRPMGQPEASPPVVAIAYGAEFRHIMNYVRGLMESGEHSPRLLVALAFGLRFCPANYNVWKRRRDVVLHAASFERCCTFGLGLSPQQWAPTVSKPSSEELGLLPKASRDARLADYEAEVARLRPYSYPPHLDGKLLRAQSDATEPALPDLTAFEGLCASWAPEGEHCLPPQRVDLPLAVHEQAVEVDAATCAGVYDGRREPPAALMRTYDVWHAVAWELRATRYTTVTIGKSFQTWNHRKELVLAAAARTAALYGAQWADCAEGAPRGDEVSHAADAGRLSLRFSDFDDRVITAYVLRNDDAKNYHAWSHRGWFIMATGAAHDADGLRGEMELTDELLVDDPFNNSAWAHRMLVLREALLRRPRVQVPRTAEEAQSGAFYAFPAYFPRRWTLNPRLAPGKAAELRGCAPIDEVLAVLRDQLPTVRSAVLYDPRNEAPYTFAVGLVRVAIDALKSDTDAAGSAAVRESVAAFSIDVMGLLCTTDVHGIAEAHPSADMGPCYAAGSTEALRRTHVEAHRDGAVHQLAEVRVQHAALLGMDAEAVVAQKEGAVTLARRLQDVDPVRRKYWFAQAAIASR